MHCTSTGHQRACEMVVGSGAAVDPIKSVRGSYTYGQKSRALERLSELEMDPACACPWTTTCTELKLPRSKWNYLTKWRKQADFIRSCVEGGYKKSSRYRFELCARARVCNCSDHTHTSSIASTLQVCASSLSRPGGRAVSALFEQKDRQGLPLQYVLAGESDACDSAGDEPTGLGGRPLQAQLGSGLVW